MKLCTASLVILWEIENGIGETGQMKNVVTETIFAFVCDDSSCINCVENNRNRFDLPGVKDKFFVTDPIELMKLNMEAPHERSL